MVAVLVGAAAISWALVFTACTRTPAEPNPATELAATAESSHAADLPGTSSDSGAPAPSPSPRPVDPAPPAYDPSIIPRWIAAASGAVPELNPVSIEQDLTLAAQVLGPGGRVLFGAGPGTPTVQVLAPPAVRDPIVGALGELFSPRGGRDLRYRATTLNHAEPATADTLVRALDHALAGSTQPLLVYLGGHGNLGDQPRHNSISLWAQSEINAADLAARLDRSPRPVRLVMTTCFSGGFAELVFRDADPSLGATPNDRCGLFAAPWDLEATGCDPNPDRAAQEGYGLHFLNALRGSDRDGKPLPLPAVDLDGDGDIIA